jgi:hypothetical protein
MSVYILLQFLHQMTHFFFGGRGKGIFREKASIPEYTGFEIGKTGIIPFSVVTFQYRIGNTTRGYAWQIENAQTAE